jgi:hypothetical protein
MKRDPHIVETVPDSADGVRDAPRRRPAHGVCERDVLHLHAGFARDGARVRNRLDDFCRRYVSGKMQPKAAMTMILAIGTPASRCTRTYWRIASICPARSRLRFLIANGSDALSEMKPPSVSLPLNASARCIPASLNHTAEYSTPSRAANPSMTAFGIGPTRNVLGIDERADLDPAKAARGERVDQRDLVRRRDRTRLDLKAFAGPLLADDDAIRQVHAAFLRMILGWL